MELCGGVAASRRHGLTPWVLVLLLQVASIQKFRKGLPPKSSVYIAKNTLMKVAVSQTEGWEELAQQGCAVSGVGRRGRWLVPRNLGSRS